MVKGIFITATDTEVGKTVVTAGIVFALRSRGISAGVMKPVATGGTWINGDLVSEDALFLAKATGCDESDLALINPVIMEPPLAPYTVTRIEKQEIDLDKIKNSYNKIKSICDFVIVEGIGGILVPVKKDYYVADMIEEMGLSVIIVARPDLGTINHTLLTIREAERRGIGVKGIVFNHTRARVSGDAEKTNPGIISELSGIPVIGILPYDAAVDVGEQSFGALPDRAQEYIDVDMILS